MLELHVLAHSWQQVLKSVECARVCNITMLGDERVDGALDHQPVENDALVESIKVLQFPGAQAECGYSTARLRL